ncbi:prolyl oligopeptidase family serine peptidase [Penaeicola halotolerans]|uniref:carboxylesterase family protein n=1 Tax=Penaeicola halotolerans TaxID=2793196 RepID=UPI001CF8EC9E|nr:prolyl oligopeptidase family serine peptidase [Penaeicola halotolerans]
MKKLLLLLLLAIYALNSIGQDVDFSLYEEKVYINENGDRMDYRILYPEAYDKSKKYPLVLFLHGAGERGSDNRKQLTHGGKLFLKPENRSKFPAIVVFPQCPEDDYWIDISVRKKLYDKEDLDFSEVNAPPSKQMSLLIELHQSILTNEAVDEKRQYVIGLSMGGFGTFDLISRNPKKFAAAIPICGGGNVTITKKYAKHTSLWITHGALDDIVPVLYSQRVYDALKKNGADVKYTEFPNANHNAWDPTFAIPDLLPWLFSKSK